MLKRPYVATYSLYAVITYRLCTGGWRRDSLYVIRLYVATACMKRLGVAAEQMLVYVEQQLLYAEDLARSGDRKARLHL